MSVFDFFLFYLYFLKYIAIFLIIFLFVFGVDDLFIDLMYWKKVLLRINSRKNREKCKDRHRTKLYGNNDTCLAGGWCG